MLHNIPVNMEKCVAPALKTLTNQSMTQAFTTKHHPISLPRSSSLPLSLSLLKKLNL